MSLTRVYLPLAPQRCRELAEQRALAGPLTAFAVTEAVRDSDPGGDLEAWEYAVLQDAAQHCLEEGLPVLVAAADVNPAQLDAGASSGSRVVVSGPLTLPRVAAFHAGDDVVRGAPAATDPDAEVELSWYDTTELRHLVSLIGEQTTR